MSAVFPVFYPAADLDFRDEAGRVLDGHAWDFESDEAVALMQAVLQTRYPMASVIATRGVGRGGERSTVLDVYRDGVASMAAATLAWLSGVYDIAGPPAYRVALGLLGDTLRAEAVVEQAFAELVHNTRADTNTAAQSVSAAAFRLARAELRAQ
jgi:hypothetical protein